MIMLSEIFGWNLYCFIKNFTINSTDYLGLADICLICPEGAKVLPIPNSDPTGCNAMYRTDRLEPNGFGSMRYDYLVPDGFFGDACTKHDNCYSKCEKSKSACDTEFGDDMRKACDKLSDWAFFSKTICKKIADLYEFAVSVGGDDSIEKSQDNYCEWDNCCFEGEFK